MPPQVLRRYVPPNVQKAIEVKALHSVSIFTDVTCLFLGLSGVDLGAVHPDTGNLWGQVRGTRATSGGR